MASQTLCMDAQRGVPDLVPGTAGERPRFCSASPASTFRPPAAAGGGSCETSQGLGGGLVIQFATWFIKRHDLKLEDQRIGLSAKLKAASVGGLFHSDFHCWPLAVQSHDNSCVGCQTNTKTGNPRTLRQSLTRRRNRPVRSFCAMASSKTNVQFASTGNQMAGAKVVLLVTPRKRDADKGPQLGVSPRAEAFLSPVYIFVQSPEPSPGLGLIPRGFEETCRVTPPSHKRR